MIDAYEILHALGGFYVIKLLVKNVRSFLIVLPDDVYMKFISPEYGRVVYKRRLVLSRLRDERIKIVSLSHVRGILQEELNKVVSEMQKLNTTYLNFNCA